MDEIGNKVENKVGPFHEGDMLVLICLAVGGNNFRLTHTHIILIVTYKLKTFR